MTMAMFIISIIIIITTTVCDGLPSTYDYSVDWSKAPTSPISETDVAKGDVDDGTCLCDLTYNACDFNCNCDADCQATSETAWFSGAEVQGRSEFSVFKCTDDSLVKVNERGDVHTSIVDNLLCVQKSNHPSDGEFFNEILTKTAEFPNINLVAQHALKCNASAYRVDEPLRGARLVNGALVAENGGLFPFPTRDHVSECSDRNAPGFMRNVYTDMHDSVCTTTSHSLAADCVGEKFSITNNLHVASTCGASESLSLSGYVPVTYTPTPPSPTWTSGTLTCSNIVKEVHYVFDVSVGGNITAARGTIVLGSVSAASATATVAFQRKFTVFFNVAGRTSIRPKSGNPGYLVGFPVLGGKEVTQSGSSPVITVIQQNSANVSVVPHTSDGECTASTSTAEHHVITFGEDATFSCLLPLTIAQLQAHCGTTTVSDQYLSLSTNVTHLGVWGNADYTQRNQWISVITDPKPLSASWLSNQLMCTQMIDSSVLTILYANIGAIDNPQAKIIDAKYVYNEATQWQHYNRSATQYFPVTMSVRFVRIQAPYHESIPDAPPIMPRLPNDILYPLYVDNANSGHHTSPTSIMLIVILPFITTIILASDMR